MTSIQHGNPYCHPVYRNGVLYGKFENVARIQICYKTFTQSNKQNCASVADMIFVKTFTLADFGPVIFYPKAHNSLKSCDHNSLSIEAFKPIQSIHNISSDGPAQSSNTTVVMQNNKSEILKGLKSTSVWKNFSTSKRFKIRQFCSFKIICRGTNIIYRAVQWENILKIRDCQRHLEDLLKNFNIQTTFRSKNILHQYRQCCQ